MSSLALTEDRTRTELWTSFASLLRSYCAAHGLNAPHQAVVEVSAGSITVRVADRWLLLQERDGHVTATRGDGVKREFDLHEDGSVYAQGYSEEMDMAAERFARELFIA